MLTEDKILKAIEYRTCDTCKNIDLDGSKFPCKDCTSFMCYWEINPKYKELIDKKEQEKHEEHYDEHYVSAHQPIETMQANMSHDEFIGFLKGNIIKYVCRLGKKDNIEKETAKIKRYAEWLEQAVKGQTIDPRK